MVDSGGQIHLTCRISGLSQGIADRSGIIISGFPGTGKGNRNEISIELTKDFCCMSWTHTFLWASLSLLIDEKQRFFKEDVLPFIPMIQ